MRVVLSPPDVKEPAGHVLQPLAPSSLYCSSLPHAEQLLEFAAANSPAEHFETTLVPSHAEPAGHTLHAVRVDASPPVVKEPAGHIEHSGALFSLYVLSLPHGSQRPLCDRNVPARQNVH